MLRDNLDYVDKVSFLEMLEKRLPGAFRENPFFSNLSSSKSRLVKKLYFNKTKVTKEADTVSNRNSDESYEVNVVQRRYTLKRRKLSEDSQAEETVASSSVDQSSNEKKKIPEKACDNDRSPNPKRRKRIVYDSPAGEANDESGTSSQESKMSRLGSFVSIKPHVSQLTLTDYDLSGAKARRAKRFCLSSSPILPQETVEEEKFTFFFTKKYPFSNHYPCKFKMSHRLFNCTEQYYMYQKAKTFNDDENAAEILKCNDPKKMKSIGSGIKGFDKKIWDAKSEKVMLKCNYVKYIQNRDLRLALFATIGTTLVETNPSDQRWGIGLSMLDVAARRRSTWRGQNLLGQLLTRIRDELVKLDEYADDFLEAKANKAKYSWWNASF